MTTSILRFRLWPWTFWSSFAKGRTNPVIISLWKEESIRSFSCCKTRWWSKLMFIYCSFWVFWNVSKIASWRPKRIWRFSSSQREFQSSWISLRNPSWFIDRLCFLFWLNLWSTSQPRGFSKTGKARSQERGLFPCSLNCTKSRRKGLGFSMTKESLLRAKESSLNRGSFRLPLSTPRFSQGRFPRTKFWSSIWELSTSKWTPGFQFIQ